MIITDIVYSGNGFIAAFDDDSVANGQFKVVNGVLIIIGLSTEQQIALSNFNDTINVDDPRFQGGPAGPIGPTGPAISGALVRMSIEVVGKGTGASKSTTTIIGSSVLGESFGIGDELYLVFPVPINTDRTINAEIHFGWVPSGAEVGKTISWDVDILSMNGGTIASGTTGTVQIVDAAVPTTQFESTDAKSILASATYLGPTIQTLHVRVKRVASAADPVSNPIVIHAHFEYTSV